MVEEIEYRGQWFLPDIPHQKSSGVLKFTPSKGTLLEIDGLLGEQTALDNFLNPNVILGIIAGDKKITLCNCHQIATSIYSANTILIGYHFERLADINFKELTIRYQNLYEWTEIKGITSCLTDDRGLVINCNGPQSQLLSSTIQREIYLETSYSKTSFRRSQVSIEFISAIRIEFATSISLLECIHFVQIIQNFLGLAMTSLPFPVKITGNINTLPSERDCAKNAIEIVYNPLLSYEYNVVNGKDMLFTYPKVKERIGNFLENWETSYEKFKPLFNLFFANSHNPTIYTENRFLNLSQALETYHRLMFGGKYQTDEEYLRNLYVSFCSTIPDDIHSDFRRSLVEGKLRYAHEYSLRKRLTDLINRFCWGIPEDIIESGKKRSYFIDTAVATRNYLTHYDESSQQNSVSGVELFYLEQGMKLLVEVILLSEIGFTLYEVRDMVQNSKSYHLFRQWKY